MKKESKAAIYKAYGIEYKSGKIMHDKLGMIPEMLIDGNAKIGKGVWHFSTLPTNQEYKANVSGKEITIKGTCACNCDGCYATKGNYRFASTINSLALRTWIARNDIDYLNRAIRAQIESCDIKTIRIHASGDFFSKEYADMWIGIVRDYPGVTFWTYTKTEYESIFDSFENANIVKSVIPGIGFNFGHCDYIESTYNNLTAAGKRVHICKCGIDKNQHCTDCKGCSENEYVLFIEHSTAYNAVSDPAYNRIVELINSQKK